MPNAARFCGSPLPRFPERTDSGECTYLSKKKKKMILGNFWEKLAKGGIGALEKKERC